MVLRESNARFLEVLELPQAIGVPIELDIFDGASPSTLLATLENAKDIALQQQLNEPGSASFRINRHDPKATAAIVDRENLAKIKVGGIYRFAFWMRERKIVVLQEQEQAEEYWSIGGPGALAVLDRAEMWTVSYVGDGPIAGVWDLGNGFGGNSVGQMYRRVIDESLAKTPSPIGIVSTNWDYDVDSHGEIWADSADLEVNVGDNLLGVTKLLTGLGLDVRMRHDLMLEAFVELGRHFDVDSLAVRPVVFRGGQNVTTSLSRRSQGGIATRALVKGSGDLVLEVSRLDLEADPYIGRREIFLSVSNAKDATTMQRAGEAELEGRLADTEAISFGVDHGLGVGQYEPWADYDIGDWITLDEPGVYDLATYRVVGWTISQAEDDYAIVLDCNSIEYEDLLKLARKGGLDGAGGSTGGSSTVGSGVGGGGGGSTGSSSKVAVETSDSPGYLYDKIQAGAGISKALVGASGSRKVEIAVGSLGLDALSDVNLAGAADGQYLKRVGGVWVPATVAGGGGGGKGKYQNPPTSGLIDDFSDASISGWTLVRDEARTLWSEAYGALHASRNTAVPGAGTRDAEAYVRTISLAIGDYVEAAFDHTMLGNYHFVGICLSDGAVWGAGAQVMAWMHGNGSPSSTENVRLQHYTSWNSYGADGTSFTSVPSAYDPTYVRLKYEAANTWGMYWSRDGVAWRTIQTNFARTLTPTHVGVCVLQYDNQNLAGEGGRFFYLGKNTP